MKKSHTPSPNPYFFSSKNALCKKYDRLSANVEAACCRASPWRGRPCPRQGYRPGTALLDEKCLHFSDRRPVPPCPQNPVPPFYLPSNPAVGPRLGVAAVDPPSRSPVTVLQNSCLLIGSRAQRENLQRSQIKRIINEIIIKIYYFLILYVFLISRPLGRFKLCQVDFATACISRILPDALKLKK